MFLQRTFAAFKSLFSRKPADTDQNAEARIILKRVRELMELTPGTLSASCAPEPMVPLDAARAATIVDLYGTYADPH